MPRLRNTCCLWQANNNNESNASCDNRYQRQHGVELEASERRTSSASTTVSAASPSPSCSSSSSSSMPTSPWSSPIPSPRPSLVSTLTELHPLEAGCILVHRRGENSCDMNDADDAEFLRLYSHMSRTCHCAWPCLDVDPSTA